MDVLVLISNCPQLNNPCNAYNPTPGARARPGRRIDTRRRPAGRPAALSFPAGTTRRQTAP